MNTLSRTVLRRGLNVHCVSRTAQYTVSSIVLGGGGGDHHAPNMPPFARLRPPSTKLPEEVELVWDDTVAPETAIDFDAPHVSTAEVLKMFFGAFACFAGLYGLVALSDPVGSNPVALRSSVIPESTMQQILGAEVVNTEEEEEEE